MAAITLRSVKGSELTHGEVDANFTNLNTDKVEAGGNVATATALATSRNFSIAGGGITAATVGFTGAAAVVLAASVDAGHITLARMADVATATVFYRKTAATGVPEVQTLATLKTDLGLTGTNSGDQASIVGITGTKAQFDTAVSDGNIVYVSDPIVLPAGSTTVQPLKFVSGTVNTTPVAGVNEYDGSSFFAVETTTSGRGYVPVTYGYNYTGAGSALGPTIADFFPATSSINLLASSVYEIEVVAYFLKSTAGTVVWTWLASSAPNAMISSYVGSAITGFTTTPTTTAPITGFAAIQTNTVLAHAATGSLTTAVRHAHMFSVTINTNAATNLRLRVTSSAGTVTPQAGSYYRVTRITTSGAFAA